MVVTTLPARSDMGVTHARTASPSTCTVQLPHRAAPQPNLVPVRPSSSRKYHRSGIDGSPSNVRSCPLTRKVATAFPPPLLCFPQRRRTFDGATLPAERSLGGERP